MPSPFLRLLDPMISRLWYDSSAVCHCIVFLSFYRFRFAASWLHSRCQWSGIMTVNRSAWPTDNTLQFNAMYFVLSGFSFSENGPGIFLSGHFSKASHCIICLHALIWVSKWLKVLVWRYSLSVCPLFTCAGKPAAVASVWGWSEGMSLSPCSSPGDNWVH